MVRRTFAVAVALAWWVAGGGGQATANTAAGRGASVPTPKQLAEQARAEHLNLSISLRMIFLMAGFAGLLLLYRLTSTAYAQLRLMVSLNSENQRFFAAPAAGLEPFIKKHILYAPLFRVRHNRELRLSSALNMGTLPTRFQAFFLLGYLATNIAFCTYNIDYSNREARLSQLRNRAGVMAVSNLAPLFLMSGRNNPFIILLGIPYDTFNLIHRWLGRIVVLEATLHASCWMVDYASHRGWAATKEALITSNFLLPGVTALIGLMFLLIHSPSPIRHAFYESFLVFHIAAAILVIAGAWYHLGAKPDMVPWSKGLKIAISAWVVERALRLLRLLYCNLGWKMTTATVEALPGDACRVTVRMPRPWGMRPGQHLYLYIPSLGLWTGHPFSITWSDREHELHHHQHHSHQMTLGDEKLQLPLPMSRHDLVRSTDKSMSLIVRRRTGFTDTLYRKAISSPNRVFTARAFAEGPYGGLEAFGSYGTVILIAGGVGITHPVPYIKELVEGYANGTVATRRITLVWVIQTAEHLEWIRPWMTKILAMEKRREVLKILLFVTRPGSTKEIHSPSSTVQMFPGRPNFSTLLNMEIENKMGAICVSVCGSGSLSDDVRAVVRAKEHMANIHFIEEAFSW